MQMFTLNRRGMSLVLGLQWPEKQALQDRDDAVEAFAAAHNVEATQVRFVSCESKAGKVRIFGMADPDGEPVGNKSLAMSMLCLAHGDGIYAVVIGDDAFSMSMDGGDAGSIKVWICSINDGIVSRETIVSRDEVTQHVNEMSMIRQRSVYATAGCGIRDAQVLDLDAMIAGLGQAAIELAKFRKMASNANRKAGKFLYIPIVIVAILAGVLLYRHHKAEVAREQILKAREAARVTYLSTAPSKIGVLPVSSHWMQDAVSVSYQAFPVYLDGFTLKVIQCDPSACKAAYFIDRDTSFSGSLFENYFKSMPALSRTSGKASVSFVYGNSAGAIVRLPMDFKTRAVNAALLSNQPSHRHGIEDWIGIEMHAFLPGKIKSRSVIDMGSMGGGDLAGMPPLYVSKVAIDGNGAMPASMAGYIGAAGSINGFVPVMIEWSPGVGPSASFRVQFIQLSSSASH